MKKSDASAWFENFKESLPEGWGVAIDHAQNWVEENPSTAALIGTTAGLAVGLLGVRKVVTGIQFARKSPLVTGLAVSAASSVIGSFVQRGEKSGS